MKDIITYLKNNVIGKTLITDELIYSLKDNTLEGAYSDQIIFSSLRESDQGFYFDMSVIAKEMIYATSWLRVEVPAKSPVPSGL